MLQAKYGKDNWQTMEYMLVKVDALISKGKVKEVLLTWAKIKQVFASKKESWQSSSGAETK